MAGGGIEGVGDNTGEEKVGMALHGLFLWLLGELCRKARIDSQEIGSSLTYDENLTEMRRKFPGADLGLPESLASTVLFANEHSMRDGSLPTMCLTTAPLAHATCPRALHVLQKGSIPWARHMLPALEKPSTPSI